jgi:hypothetical protein
MTGPAQPPAPINPHPGGAFGFLEEPFGDPAETPTLRSGGATLPSLRSPSGRRRVVVFDDGNAAAGSRRSTASGIGGIGGGGGGGISPPQFSTMASSAAAAAYRRRPSTSDTPDMHSPGSDTQGVGGLGGLGGLRYAASSRSLSQAALSELAER